MADQPLIDQLKVVVESVLFIADEPVELSYLTRIAQARLEDISQAIEQLAGECQRRGVRIQRTGNAIQFVTAPESAAYVERFLGLDEDHRISHAGLETLAIVAYRQPISRSAVEAIRGVSCDRAIASLKARGLVTEVGRGQSAGRPYLYGTTFRFLEHFGLEKPEDLPPLTPLDQEADGGNGT